jgi:hypothetical protein
MRAFGLLITARSMSPSESTSAATSSITPSFSFELISPSKPYSSARGARSSGVPSPGAGAHGQGRRTRSDASNDAIGDRDDITSSPRRSVGGRRGGTVAIV